MFHCLHRTRSKLRAEKSSCCEAGILNCRVFISEMDFEALHLVKIARQLSRSLLTSMEKGGFRDFPKLTSEYSHAT